VATRRIGEEASDEGDTEGGGREIAGADFHDGST